MIVYELAAPAPTQHCSMTGRHIWVIENWTNQGAFASCRNCGTKK